MDFRVGGLERARYRLNAATPFPGVALINEGSYQDIVPDRRVVTASTISLGGKRISVSLVTIELLATGEGTDLICTRQGALFDGSGGPQMREAGWRLLFERLGETLALEPVAAAH
jgi:uncharacterized protein YndB with AHSA1/START domain